MHSRQILVVDDTPLLARLSNALLTETRARSTRIDIAASAKDALDLHGHKPYDLLVINCEAGTSDVMDVLRQLRAADHETEAVIVAGWLTPRLLERGRELGVTRFFRLPAELSDLSYHLTFPKFK